MHKLTVRYDYYEKYTIDSHFVFIFLNWPFYLVTCIFTIIQFSRWHLHCLIFKTQKSCTVLLALRYLLNSRWWHTQIKICFPLFSKILYHAKRKPRIYHNYSIVIPDQIDWLIVRQRFHSKFLVRVSTQEVILAPDKVNN